ncbi:MAG: DUF1828 domain-containing protein [Candidatus Puniceispirillaceae bacterium]
MTLKQEVETLTKSYLQWLGDKTDIEQVSDDFVTITTPQLDRHNDALQIIVTRDKDGVYTLSDDGWTIMDLQASGCEINSSKRSSLLSEITNGFGVRVEDGVLLATTSAKTFSEKKHDLLQAMLSVNDLFFTSSTYARSFFMEDVGNWFENNDIIYSPSVKFTGKSGLTHQFDFLVPGRGNDNMIKTMNNPTNQSAKNLIMASDDIRKIRPRKATSFAFINDAVDADLDSVISALANCEVKPVLWSKRDTFKEYIVN